jgi:hypothetical protein
MVTRSAALWATLLDAVCCTAVCNCTCNLQNISAIMSRRLSLYKSNCILIVTFWFYAAGTHVLSTGGHLTQHAGRENELADPNSHPFDKLRFKLSSLHETTERNIGPSFLESKASIPNRLLNLLSQVPNKLPTWKPCNKDRLCGRNQGAGIPVIKPPFLTEVIFNCLNDLMMNRSLIFFLH